MARSSDMSTTNQYVKYYINCTQNSQNITNNTSNVTVTVSIYRTNSGYPTWGTGTMYCTINGTQYTAGITPSQVFDSTPVTVFTKTLDIPHNSDGTKVLSMSAYVTHDMFSSSSQSYSQTLTTIARKSVQTLSASSVAMDSAITITTNRASTSFTHTLKYIFGSSSGTIATGVTTSYAWTIPLSLASQVPNATSGTGTIICETYNGSTLIGSNNVTFTATVPSAIVPSFTSLTISRVDNGVPSAWGVYVKGKSKATVSIAGATGSYGSTITSYNISGGGYSGTTSTLNTGTLSSVGTITFTGKITDSRGRTATKTNTISVVDYFNPSVSSFSSFRANSGGSALDDGTYIRCSASFSYASVSTKNTISANVKYRRVGAGVWSTATTITNGGAITIGAGGISIDASYEVLLSVTDAFSTTTNNLVISTSSVTMDFKKGGKGVAVGKVAETDNLFDVAWDTSFSKSVLFDTKGVEQQIKFTGCATDNSTVYFYNGNSSSGTRIGLWDSVNGSVFAYTTNNVFNFNKNVSIAGSITVNNSWLYTTGNTGWFNSTYQGGWYMNDSTWIKSYNSKNVFVDKVLRADGGLQVGTNGSAVNLGSTGHIDASGQITAKGNMYAGGYHFHAGSYMSGRTGGGFDFWFTPSGVRITFDGVNHKIYRVSATGTWTVIAG